MAITMTAGEIAERLAEDAASVAMYLLPEGKRQGAEWCVGDITGKKGQSLRVRLTGTKAGVWRDFATEDGGDLLDLWAAVRALPIAKALDEAREFLGIRRPDFQGTRRERVRVTPPKDTAKAGADSAVMDWLTRVRAIPVEVVEKYRVAARRGAVALPAFTPDGSAVQYVKYRSITEKKYWSEAGGRPCLFGWQAIPEGTRSVVICEGELDALAWAAYGFPALSPTNGAGNFEWIDTEFDALARFDCIHLSFDQDMAGMTAVTEIVERLGAERVRVVTLPHKDANDCLVFGVAAADMQAAIASARSVDPEELLPASGFAEAVVDELHGDKRDAGVVFPWRKASDQFRFRPGEVSLIGGVNGHGKSELAGHLTLAAMEQGARVCVASMEFKPAKWLARLARQAGAVQRPSPDFIRAIHRWYDGKAWVFNVTGTAKAARILEVFRYAVRRYGIRWFVVDNLAKCGFAEDDYNAQKRFIDELTDFARDHDAHVMLCAHMRKGETEDKPAGKMDIKGTGAIVDMVDSALVVWRNKPKERERIIAEQAREHFDESEKPDAIISVVKQRNGDYEPRIGLWFCRRSHQFLDSHCATPRRFVDWSADDSVNSIRAMSDEPGHEGSGSAA